MILNLLLFLGYTIGSVVGLLILKLNVGKAMEALSGSADWKAVAFTVLGAVFYIGGFVLWLGILSRLPLSFAYPIAIGLSLLFVSLTSGLLLGEHLSLTRIAGTLIIFIGVIVVSRSA